MESVILVGVLVLLAAIGAAKIGARLGLPSLLLFLGLGLLLGDGVLGIQFSDAHIAEELGLAALVLILTEGGLSTRWSSIKPALAVSTLLATLGVIVCVALTAGFAYYVLHLPIFVAVLLAACLAPTDSAAVFAVLRNVGLPSKVTAILEGESGLNDAPSYLLVVAATGMVGGAGIKGGWWGLAGLIAVELVGGILLGIALGVLGSVLLRAIALPASGLYPLATVGWVVLSYALGSWIHVSGFAAVYICALILGNSDLPHRNATRSFAEGIGWIAQIGLFVMLGLLATPARLTASLVGAAVATGLFLSCIARPIAVALCSVPFKLRFNEQLFISWAGLRGAVPIVLATVPMATLDKQGSAVFDLVFVLVVVFTVLQSPSLTFVARRLGLIDPMASKELEIEVAPLEGIKAELMHLPVPRGSKLAGVTVSELRFAKTAVVSLIVRADGSTVVPDDSSIIRTGDQLLIVVARKHRNDVERRLREVDRGGRLARWNKTIEATSGYQKAS